MLVFRPVDSGDLPQLQRLARESLVGVTSCPTTANAYNEKFSTHAIR